MIFLLQTPGFYRTNRVLCVTAMAPIFALSGLAGFGGYPWFDRWMWIGWTMWAVAVTFIGISLADESNGRC